MGPDWVWDAVRGLAQSPDGAAVQRGMRSCVLGAPAAGCGSPGSAPGLRDTAGLVLQAWRPSGAAGHQGGLCETVAGSRRFVW